MFQKEVDMSVLLVAIWEEDKMMTAMIVKKMVLMVMGTVMVAMGTVMVVRATVEMVEEMVAVETVEAVENSIDK